MSAVYKLYKKIARNSTARSTGELSALIPYHRLDARVKYFATAHIATDLGPELDNFVRKRSVIRIIGYGGEALVKPNYRWMRDISAWAESGAEIRYLLSKQVIKQSVIDRF